MTTVLDFSKPNDLVFFCLYRFAFFLFAKKSNLVPTSRKDCKGFGNLIATSRTENQCIRIITSVIISNIYILNVAAL